MNAGRSARERVRAEITREITDIARRQLATDGAAGLSLRAVAREMGMASSAIYRYFPSRDDLLTALIIDGYNAVGDAAESAEGAVPRADHSGRWLALAGAIRGWALTHPHEYALLYGSPVPGYQAPQDTVAPALRDTMVFGRIVSDAYAAGALAPDPAGPPAPGALAEDAERVRQIMPGVPDDVVARALAAWTTLFGMITFELLGQFEGVIIDRGTLFRHVMTLQGRLVGLTG